MISNEESGRQLRSDKIRNPILRGVHPDPTVCRVGKTFYLATSTFGIFPGIPLYASEDLADWRFVRHILSRPEQVPFPLKQPTTRAGIFAPTLRHDGTRFYLVTTNFKNGGNFILSAVDPAGEWSDPLWLEDAYQGGIDPSLTILSAGRALYQVTADPGRGDSPGITQFELDLTTGRGLSPRRHLSSGCGWKFVEAPHLFFREGYWYLLMAEGGTEANHRVTIARSRSEWGPWTPCPGNPILSHAGIESPIQNTGHADFFEDGDGRWWAAFLGVRTLGYPSVHITGRETFLASVEWASDGWPVVNQDKPITIADEDPEPFQGAMWTDNFSSEILHQRWVTVGAAYESVYEKGSDGLRLKAASSSLSSNEIKAFVGTRLDAHERRYETVVRAIDGRNEAGIAVFMEATGYYALGLRKGDNGETEIRLTRRVLDLETVDNVRIEHSERVTLRIDLIKKGSPWDFDHSEFVFSAKGAGDEWVDIGRGTSRLLSTEVIGGFTGLLVGMYCVQADSEMESTARFETFSASFPE